MRLSSSLLVYSLQLLAATSLVPQAAAFVGDRDPVPYHGKATQIGHVYDVTVSSNYNESEVKPVTSEDGKSDTYTLKYEDATYVSVHFSKFDLPSSCSLDITGPSGEHPYTLTGQGKFNLGTFWGRLVKGDTMKLFLSCEKKEEKELALFEIDQFAAGFPESFQPDGANLTPERRLGDKDFFFPKSPNDVGVQSICGTDDKMNAICYKDSEPAIYGKARAVARLYINGSSACTGWLVSASNLLVTNQHCIDSLSDVQNTEFEFMGEEDNCAVGSSDGSFMSDRNPDGIYDGSDLLELSADWDMALVQLVGDPASTYGFLELDNRKPPENEEIYIPQHPGARPKEIGVFDTNHQGNCKVMTYSAGCSPEDMRYSCDTEGGSSGSPVLSRTNNKVVALHHCGGGCNGNLGAPIYQFHDLIAKHLPVATSAPSSDGPPCKDRLKDQFFFRKKNGKYIVKRCKWLMGKSDDKIDKICTKRTQSWQDYGPAKDVCKETCGTC